MAARWIARKVGRQPPRWARQQAAFYSDQGALRTPQAAPGGPGVGRGDRACSRRRPGGQAEECTGSLG